MIDVILSKLPRVNIYTNKTPIANTASIAQWQSTALVKQGSWVQTPLGACFFSSLNNS